ncbi:MAG: AAA family ATPase [Chloroflexi bacterium]|nr:AAA family ATPase [Chloroflexota bacterium]
MTPTTLLPPLIERLLDPAAYPHPVEAVTLLQTHVSFILLAGPYAYKIKKPVDMGFLDFTSLADRERFCRRELALNRRLCPAIYLAVVPITDMGGLTRISGEGPPVEWTVQMRRLPAERMLPTLLAMDAVAPVDVARIAERLAAFHAEAATGGEIDDYGTPALIRRNVEENFAQLQPFVGQTLPPGHARRLTDAAGAFLRDHPGLFADRIRRRHIRDCHGDVHAGSICLTDDLAIFDCIEFNDRFRYSDVAAEVAFLAMDLDHYGRADLAWAFVAAYERAADDHGLASLLDFYKTYRAVVRGKVESFRSAQSSVPAPERAAAAAAAREYFDLAFAYAGGVARPALLITCGLMGTGKTALADALARRLALVHLTADATRKRLVGLRPTDHAYTAFGQGLYSPEMSRRTYDALLADAYTWLSRGCSVIIDASFKRASERARARALAASLDVPFAAIECVCPADVVRQRVTDRLTVPGTVSDARWDLYAAQRADFDPVVELRPDEHLLVDTTAPHETCAEQVRAWLAGEAGRWQQEPIRAGRTTK